MISRPGCFGDWPSGRLIGFSVTMKTRLFGTVLAAALVCAVTATAASPIRVMLLDGEQAGAYHAWQETTPYLQRMLNDAGLFQVDVVTAPPPNADFSSFKPDWSK